MQEHVQPKDTELELELSFSVPSILSDVGKLKKFWTEFGSQRSFTLTTLFEAPEILEDFLVKQRQLINVFYFLQEYGLPLFSISFSSRSFKEIMERKTPFMNWDGDICTIESGNIKDWTFDQSETLHFKDKTIQNFNPFIKLEIIKEPENTGCGYMIKDTTKLCIPLAGIISAVFLKPKEEYTLKR